MFPCMYSYAQHNDAYQRIMFLVVFLKCTRAILVQGFKFLLTVEPYNLDVCERGGGGGRVCFKCPWFSCMPVAKMK